MGLLLPSLLLCFRGFALFLELARGFYLMKYLVGLWSCGMLSELGAVPPTPSEFDMSHLQRIAILLEIICELILMGPLQLTDLGHLVASGDHVIGKKHRCLCYRFKDPIVFEWFGFHRLLN
jgi:hypothetical protein